ncbi:MAG: hypothetical protein JXO22_06225 [Phycisphaerae bacterium]|nr:hypothetical protein [Phycisphaerae bacterium]
MIGVLGYSTQVACIPPAGNASALPDQDFLTQAVEAARGALAHAGVVTPERIGAVYVGIPAEAPHGRPLAADVCDVLGVSERAHCADLSCAGKGGTEAFFAVCNLVKPSAVEVGLALAVDALTPVGPEVRLAGAAAYLIGRHPDEMLATVDLEFAARAESVSSPGTLERAPGPSLDGQKLQQMTRELMARKRLRPADFAHVAFRLPDETLPPAIAVALGFVERQLSAGYLGAGFAPSGPSLGLMQLAAMLDVAEPAETLLVCALGEGVGADAFVLTASERVSDARTRLVGTRPQIEQERRAWAALYAGVTPLARS